MFEITSKEVIKRKRFFVLKILSFTISELLKKVKENCLFNTALLTSVEVRCSF